MPDLEKLAGQIAKALIVGEGEDRACCTSAQLKGRLRENRLPITGGYDIGGPCVFPGTNMLRVPKGFAGEFASKTEGADREVPYVKLILKGFSRGAVMAFLLAKKLHEMGLNVPIEIDADEPVPGNAWLGGKAKVAADLSECSNVRRVHIRLPAYLRTSSGNRFLNAFHRTFFSPLVPKFHVATKVMITVINKIDHWTTSERTSLPNRADQLMGVLSGERFSRRVLFSMLKYQMLKNQRPSSSVATTGGTQEKVGVERRSQLVTFLQEVMKSTSLWYNMVFRSDRKGDFFTMILYEIKAMPSVTAEQARNKLVEIFKNASIQRGGNYFPCSNSLNTKSLKKARQLLSGDDDRFTLLRDSEVETKGSLASSKDKRNHYEKYF